MPNHTITQTGQVCQCDACGWRAILTTQGPFIRDKGDEGVDHLAAQQTQLAARQAYAEQVKRGLIARWRAERPYSMAQMKRLFDAIRSEHEL